MTTDPSASAEQLVQIVVSIDPWRTEMVTLAQAQAFANGNPAWRTAGADPYLFRARTWRELG